MQRLSVFSVKALFSPISGIDDPRDRWRVKYPLPEVLFLAISGTISGCNSYDEFAEWGEAHLNRSGSVVQFLQMNS